jgi:DNA-binding response OmpR family regulator
VQTHPGTVYRFGPFEVNAASGELLKNGRSIRLQEQPYRLLLVLLETLEKSSAARNFAAGFGEAIPSLTSTAA